MVNQYQPLPNQTGANNFGGFTRAEDTQDQFITRIDHVLSEKQKLFGHYLYQHRDNPTTPINPDFPAPRLFNNHSVAIQHVTTWSSTMLNEVRFGYMRGSLNRLSPRRTDRVLGRRRPRDSRHAGRRPQRPPAERERDWISDDQHSGVQRIRRQRRWRRHRQEPDLSVREQPDPDSRDATP